jgi:hypothetical protein
MTKEKSGVLDQLKAWLFPIVLGIFATYLFQDIREIKNDIKTLIAQSNIDKTRIDNLERQVFSRSSLIENSKQSPVEKKNHSDNSLILSLFCTDYRKKKLYDIELV